MIIYKTTNLVNGKIYVGQLLKDKPNYLGSGLLIRRAIAKHGRKSFVRKILERCNSVEELDKREKYWIKRLKSQRRKIGYNILEGGQGTGANGTRIPLETRIKISRAMKGIKKSEEHKKKLGDAQRGKKRGPCSESRREAISLGRRGIPMSEQAKKKLSIAIKGFKHTEETKLKISKAGKGKKRSEETRRRMSLVKLGPKNPMWKGPK